MGAYGSPELPIISPEGSPPARPRQRSTAAGVRFLRALWHVTVVTLCILGALAVLGGVLSLTEPHQTPTTWSAR